MPTVFYSKIDPAGVNIAENLRKHYKFAPSAMLHNRFPSWRNSSGVELIELGTSPVETDYLEQFFKGDYFIFATRHASAAGKKSFTVHPCGNWGSEAKLGGRPHELALAAPLQMKEAIQFLKERNQFSEFDVVFEATHHGPTQLSTPLFFIEVGSTEKEWPVPEYGGLIADAIVHVLSTKPQNQKIAIGIGGIHYEYEFVKEALSRDIAIGHMAPKHAIAHLTIPIIKQALRKSGASHALIEWKSLKALEREKVIRICEEIGISWERI